MKSKDPAIEFFDSIPDQLLMKLAMYDWISLYKICISLSLDLQLLKEESERDLES